MALHKNAFDETCSIKGVVFVCSVVVYVDFYQLQ